MRTIIAIVVLIASVSSASSNATTNDIERYATPNTIAKLTSEERRQVNSFISSGKSTKEIRKFIIELTK